MSYFIDFQSFKDVTKKAESFNLVVVPNQGTPVMSSAIPICALDDVMVEIDLVTTEGLGLSVWVQGGGTGKIHSFSPGSINKIELQFYP